MSVTKNNAEGVKRFTKNRFGLFIHWGLYAMGARHEWLKKRENITTEDYQKYFELFEPDLYDPKIWAKEAKAAGMKYVVLTAKHHEGFCLWDTKFTDYKVTKTKIGRDLFKEYVEAFRAEGIRIGVYYSLLDWHHPDYTTDFQHPMSGNPEYVAKDKDRDMTKYAAYIRNQVTELLSNYGEMDVLFLDFSVIDHEKSLVIKGHEAWQSEKLIEVIRKLQPQILINDRLDIEEEWAWDLMTPEQILMRKAPTKNGKPALWETCQTFSGSWGYHRDESSWKSPRQLLTLLIDSVSKNGNLLMNVGPTARGELDERAKKSLQAYGVWMQKHARSIYACGEAPSWIQKPEDCRLTYNAEKNTLYVHIFNWPPTGELYIDGLKGKVKYAQLLHDGSEIKTGSRALWQTKWESSGNETLDLRLPILHPNTEVPVIEIFLK